MKNFNNEKEFLDRLAEVDQNTVWTMNDPASLEFVEDKESETGLNYVTPAGFAEDIRECAMSTLWQRYGIAGPILDRLNPEAKAKLLNFATGYTPDSLIQIPIVEGKANAFLSSKYVPYKTSRLFQKVGKAVEYESFNGFWAYEGSAGVYKLNKTVTLTDRNGNEVERPVVLDVRTSDIGESSVAFRCHIRCNDERDVPMMSDINIIHMGAGVDEAIERTIDSLNAVIDTNARKLNALMYVDIDEQPKAVAKRAARWAKLPKRDSLEVINEWTPGEFTSAFDIYLVLSKVIDKQEDRNGKIRIGGDLARLIGTNWKQFDLPGDYAW